MAGSEPGDRPRTPERRGRQLAEPPSARYRDESGRGRDAAANASHRTALAGPLARAVVVAVIGAALLWVVGAVFASTAGLLFVSGGLGAAIGLVLARAAVPPRDVTPVPRRTVIIAAVVLALVAVAAAAVATWLFARQEGGTLGLLDYLFETFGPFVPGEAIVAAVTAWWGASSGPVQR